MKNDCGGAAPTLDHWILNIDTKSKFLANNVKIGNYMEFIVFILGLFIGSFLNSFIWRFRMNILETIWSERSMCPNCGHVLEAQDLIPVFSFVVLQGKCRYCQSTISPQYPFVELLFGLLILFLYLMLGFNVYFLFSVAIAFILVALLVIDVLDGVLPNKLIVSLILMIFLQMIVLALPSHSWYDAVVGGLAGFVFFMALWLVTLGRGIGVGDIKLAFALGLMTGMPGIVYTILLAFIMGALYVIPLVMTGRKGWQSAVAFGPFLIIAFYVVYFYYDQIDLLVKMYL